MAPSPVAAGAARRGTVRMGTEFRASDRLISRCGDREEIPRRELEGKSRDLQPFHGVPARSGR